MKIALATSKDLPDLDADDHSYAAALRARGASVTLPVWDDPAADAAWDAADLVVIRSTWDYSERRDDFVAWAAAVESRTRLLNPSSIVRWNTDKRLYLSDLAQQRVPMVPTAWMARGERVDLSSLLAAQSGADWSGEKGGFVLKPVIGAGSRDTIRVAAADVSGAGQAFVDAHLPRQALMVQPFLPSIADGEVSLIFFDGAYHHAVKKTPRSGDFRSQPEFGSRVVAHVPTTAERRLAEQALAAAPSTSAPLLYARVDLVGGLDRQPVVIEIELVEPCLYLGWRDGAAEALAEATLARACRS